MASEPGDVYCTGCRSAADRPGYEPVSEWPSPAMKPDRVPDNSGSAAVPPKE